MEGIREVANAYYVNLTEQQQEKAQDDFKNMKLENNKSMSLTDFLDFFLQDNYPKSVACSLFKDLDVNGDGSLDFEEFITLFYLYQSKRLLYCRGCETFLNGLYFTCIKCFDSTSNSYDLCSLCYGKKNIQHHRDAVFLDNYALLRRNIKRSSETAVDPVQVKNDENEGQYVSELWDHQENNATHEADLDDSNYQENEENEVVANASNQLEKRANEKVANIHRYRNRERIGKAFSKLGANITSKVTGRISKATDSTDCNVM
ncbi:uncharacterized protein LOC121262229 isoform X2 [Juglans microcarpa x Juglans regia]|uniref:uncharacterized protein LOC121262229 isoform X2 n=1 Tax=Juglans microcarpa x Juglans regia TaxID=2249226 RepID=UPI001B7F0237|nr:uncharacterized protein LOC121262229 isoform X2 [Juglans microcarpa x Juglans regia]